MLKSFKAPYLVERRLSQPAFPLQERREGVGARQQWPPLPLGLLRLLACSIALFCSHVENDGEDDTDPQNN